MITKNRRLAIIQELVNTHSPSSQGKLLKLLHERGFSITQTTLSRDIKELKISKIPNDEGDYMYINPQQETGNPQRLLVKNKPIFLPKSNRGFVSFEFSHQLGVIRTRPGYASVIASDIETHNPSVILGTVTGDNIVLVIPREGVSRQEIQNVLETIIPGMKKEDDELLKTSK